MCTITVADVHAAAEADRQAEQDRKAAVALVEQATALPVTCAELDEAYRRRARTGWGMGAVAGALIVLAAVQVGGDVGALLGLAGALALPCVGFNWPSRALEASSDARDRLNYLRWNAEELAERGHLTLLEQLCAEADGDARELHNLLVYALHTARRKAAETAAA